MLAEREQYRRSLSLGSQQAKLTTQAELARAFGLSQQTISKWIGNWATDPKWIPSPGEQRRRSTKATKMGATKATKRGDTKTTAKSASVSRTTFKQKDASKASAKTTTPYPHTLPDPRTRKWVDLGQKNKVRVVRLEAFKDVLTLAHFFQWSLKEALQAGTLEAQEADWERAEECLRTYLQEFPIPEAEVEE